jgi:hypothetical protein
MIEASSMQMPDMNARDSGPHPEAETNNTGRMERRRERQDHKH